MQMKRRKARTMPSKNIGGESKNHLSGGESRLESRESAQTALCEITGEGGLQKSVSRLMAVESPYLTTAVGQLRRAQLAA